MEGGTSWLNIVSQSEGLPVLFPIRELAWVIGSIYRRGVCKWQPIEVSLTKQCLAFSFSLSSLSLKMNQLKKITPKYTT